MKDAHQEFEGQYGQFSLERDAGMPVTERGIAEVFFQAGYRFGVTARSLELLQARLEAVERAAEIARTTKFRAHAVDDVDYHSGCEQTQSRIVDAIRKECTDLRAQISAAKEQTK